MNPSWLNRYCLLLSIATLVMALVGALVPTTGIERTHRMIGMTVGTLTIGLLILLWRFDSRSWLRWLGLGALLLVIAQGVLGALSLRLGLPIEVRILHALLAQLFFGTTALFVLFTSGLWRQPAERIQDAGWPTLRQMAALAPFAVLLQAALGAAYRHGIAGILPHVLSAMAVSVLIVMLAVIVLSQHAGAKTLTRPAKSLLILVLHQVPLGVLAYFLRISSSGDGLYRFLGSAVTAAHVGVGALLMGWSAAIAVLVWRNTRPASAE
jgi:cytochrome c oxidase assembly protein subunit 15